MNFLINKSHLLKAIICLTLTAGVLYADLDTNAYIDWQKGFIMAKGTSSIRIEEKGRPVDFNTGKKISINKARRDAYLRAREKAIENIVNSIKTIRLDPEKTIEELLIEDGVTQKKFSEKLLNNLVTNEYPVDFDTSVCKVKLKFFDIISALPYVFPEYDFPRSDNSPISTYYSSLIIDARGLDVEPMLMPSVYRENGLEIYGRYFIDGAVLLKGGMISYCYNEDQALKNRRAGDRPYFTIALKSIRKCPVISDRDARRILSHKNTLKNLKECKVIFIIDMKG